MTIMSEDIKRQSAQPPAGSRRKPPAWVGRVTAAVKKAEVLSVISGYLSATFLALVILLTLLDIVGRNLLHVSVVRGVTELSSWTMAAIAWLALSYTMKTDGHIQVRILVDRFPARVKRLLAVVLAALAVALLAFLVVSMWQRLMFIVDRGVQGVEVKVSFAGIYGIVFVGAVLLLLQTLAKLWHSIVPFFGGEEEGSAFGSDLDDVKHELREADQATLVDLEVGKDG
jgi:TRAP-type C4-dicarboxylate transport system permease small subunit